MSKQWNEKLKEEAFSKRQVPPDGTWEGISSRLPMMETSHSNRKLIWLSVILILCVGGFALIFWWIHAPVHSHQLEESADLLAEYKDTQMTNNIAQVETKQSSEILTDETKGTTESELNISSKIAEHQTGSKQENGNKNQSHIKKDIESGFQLSLNNDLHNNGMPLQKIQTNQIEDSEGDRLLLANEKDQVIGKSIEEEFRNDKILNPVLMALPVIWPELTAPRNDEINPLLTECYSFRPVNYTLRWYTEVFVLGGLPQRTLSVSSNEQENWLKARQHTETIWHSTGGGIRLGIQKGKWMWDVGVHYSQINEQFEYVNPDEVKVIITDIRDGQGNIIGQDSTFRIGIRERAISNTYRFLSIPVRVGRQMIRTGRWQIVAYAGLEWTRLLSHQGIIFDERRRDYSLDSDPNGYFSTGSIWQGQLSVHVGYGLTRGVELFFSPQYQKSFAPITSRQSPFRQQYNGYNLQSGIRIIF